MARLSNTTKKLLIACGWDQRPPTLYLGAYSEAELNLLLQGVESGEFNIAALAFTSFGKLRLPSREIVLSLLRKAQFGQLTSQDLVSAGLVQDGEAAGKMAELCPKFANSLHLLVGEPAPLNPAPIKGYRVHQTGEDEKETKSDYRQRTDPHGNEQVLAAAYANYRMLQLILEKLEIPEPQVSVDYSRFAYYFLEPPPDIELFDKLVQMSFTDLLLYGRGLGAWKPDKEPTRRKKTVMRAIFKHLLRRAPSWLLTNRKGG